MFLCDNQWKFINVFSTLTLKPILPVTTLFFRKSCFSLRTSYKELIWCTNYRNVHIRTFFKRWSFLWRCFFPVSILKNTFFTEHLQKCFLKLIFFEIQKEPPEVFCKYVFLKLGQNSLENTCDGVSFLIKSHANFIKKTPT